MALLAKTLSLNYLLPNFLVSVRRLFVRRRTFNGHRVTLFSDSAESLSDSQLSCNIIIIIIISVLIVNALLVFGWLQSVSYLLSSLALYLRCVLRLVSFNAQLDSMRLLSSVTNGFRFFHVRYVSYLCSPRLLCSENVGH